MNDTATDLRRMLASLDLFRECIDYTAKQTGFRRELVEKDFYCSMFLNHFSAQFPSSVVFKGGTCLSKVYTDFYRLSEDLDFTIPLPVDTRRAERRKQIEPVKKVCEHLTKELPGIFELEPLLGANESTQYIGTWGYRSVISGTTDRVKVEFGLREPCLFPAQNQKAGTLLQNAVTGAGLVPPFRINVMALPEIWAEKTRAALCRLEPAIRDFFDLDYARLNMNLNLQDATLVGMVRRKLAVPSNGPVNLSADRRIQLEKQIEGQLRPVLRTRDFEHFNLDRIWAALVALADRLKEV